MTNFFKLTIIGVLLMAFTINATTVGNPAAVNEDGITIRICPGYEVECFKFLFIRPMKAKDKPAIDIQF